MGKYCGEPIMWLPTLLPCLPTSEPRSCSSAVKEARSLTSTTDNRREMASLKYNHFVCQQAEARKKEEARRERNQALQAMQPARTREEVDAPHGADGCCPDPAHAPQSPDGS
jgi:hypothetical protein